MRVGQVFSCLGVGAIGATRFLVEAAEAAANLCYALVGETFGVAFFVLDLSKQVCGALVARAEAASRSERFRAWSDVSNAALSGFATLAYWWTSSKSESGVIGERDGMG